MKLLLIAFFALSFAACSSSSQPSVPAPAKQLAAKPSPSPAALTASASPSPSPSGAQAQPQQASQKNSAESVKQSKVPTIKPNFTGNSSVAQGCQVAQPVETHRSSSQTVRHEHKRIESNLERNRELLRQPVPLVPPVMMPSVHADVQPPQINLPPLEAPAMPISGNQPVEPKSAQGNQPVQQQIVPASKTVIGLVAEDGDMSKLFAQGNMGAAHEATVCRITGQFSSSAPCYVVFADGHVEPVNPDNRDLLNPFIAQIEAGIN